LSSPLTISDNRHFLDYDARMIKFQCPNGHTLTTSDDRAGTPAKCPKCQVPLVVPMASTDGSSATKSTSDSVAASQSGPQATEAGKSGTNAAASQSGANAAAAGKSGAAAGPEPTGDLIVFLCPNGHKLNGPARLKGKAGQCPHCGAKFRIPEDDEEEHIEDFEEVEEEPMAEEMTEEEFAAEEVEDVDIEEISEFEEELPEDDDIDELEPFEEAPPTVIDAFLSPVAEGIHPYASIITQLWAAKEPGQTIELYLQKGEVFSPELFAESLSQPLFGVFGRREKEGGHTLIMLPWENITRIEVRHIKQVPVGILK
jgi:hypothetical protein